MGCFFILELSYNTYWMAFKSNLLIILTSVDMVYKNFGKEDQEGISSMTVAEAQKYIEDCHTA